MNVLGYSPTSCPAGKLLVAVRHGEGGKVVSREPRAVGRPETAG